MIGFSLEMEYWSVCYIRIGPRQTFLKCVKAIEAEFEAETEIQNTGDRDSGIYIISKQFDLA